MSYQAQNTFGVLYVGGVSRKAVLQACANYADEEMRVFAKTKTIANDTDQSEATARRRLHELEDLGLLVRFPQWVDEGGKINKDARGRRINDEIKLISTVAQPDIDARAKAMGLRWRKEDGEPDDGDDESGPTNLQGQSSGADDISPTNLQGPSPPNSGDLQGRPLHCGKGKESLPESEKIPPNPPSGGGQAVIDQDLENDIAEFSKGYPAPITNLPRLRIVLTAMTPQERQRVSVAVKGYAEFIASCERKKKPRAVKDADRWVSSGMWQGYAAAGERVEVQALATTVPIDSASGKAFATLHKIAGMSSPFASAGGYYLPRPLSAQALALARAPPESEWELIPAEDVHRVRAWDDLIGDALKGKARPQLVHTRNRGGVRGFRAPWPWPPRKDGSLYTGPPISDQDASDFK